MYICMGPVDRCGAAPASDATVQYYSDAREWEISGFELYIQSGASQLANRLRATSFETVYAREAGSRSCEQQTIRITTITTTAHRM